MVGALTEVVAGAAYGTGGHKLWQCSRLMGFMWGERCHGSVGTLEYDGLLRALNDVVAC